MGARFFRTLAAAAAVLISTLAFGQGSASGYGAGASPGAGGFGGGGMGSADGLYPPDSLIGRAEVDITSRMWTSRTAILTPGDHVEFKFELKANEVLLASATGESFDAALNVADAKGQILLKNDDRREGDQSPLVVFRALADGSYSLKVLSFRSVAGGRFTVQFRRFMPVEGKYGRHKYLTTTTGTDETRRLALRISLKKGQIVDLYQGPQQGLAGVAKQVRKIIGPSGVPENDFEIIPSQSAAPVFLAKVDGDFYVEYDAGGDHIEAILADVPVTRGQAVFSHSFDLESRAAHLLEFPVKKGQLIWTTLKGTSFYSMVSVPGSDERQGTGDGYTYRSTGGFSEWQTSYNDLNDTVRIYKVDGVARAMIRSFADQRQTVKLTNRDSIPEWSAGLASKLDLGISEIKLFRMSSRKSELMKVAVEAKEFIPVLDIFSIWGDRANSLANRETLRAADDLYFPNEGEWIVRVSCAGHGGSGTFTMLRDVPKAIPYTLGSNLNHQLDGANFGLYKVNLEKGKRYELLAGEQGRRLTVDILDDEGQFLRPQTIAFESVRASYFVPSRSGEHRIWIRGEVGDTTMRLSLHKPPTVP